MTKQELLDKATENGEKILQNSDKVPIEDRNELYGLYYQLKNGDNNTEKPTSTAGRDLAKWEVWNTKRGLTDEQAYEQLIKLQNEIISKYLK